MILLLPSGFIFQGNAYTDWPEASGENGKILRVDLTAERIMIKEILSAPGEL